jgi:hypothetical protein
MIRRLIGFYRRCRSAVTGRFVSREEADANPRETTCEKVKRK